MQRRAARSAWDMLQLAQCGAPSSGATCAVGALDPAHLLTSAAHAVEHAAASTSTSSVSGSTAGQQLQQVRSYCSPHPPGLGLATRTRALRSPRLTSPAPPCQQQQDPAPVAPSPAYSCPACASTCHATALEQARTLRPPRHASNAAASAAHSSSTLTTTRGPHPHAYPPPSNAASLYTASWAEPSDDDRYPTALPSRLPAHIQWQHNQLDQPQQPQGPASLLGVLTSSRPIVLDLTTLAPRAPPDDSLPSTSAPVASAHSLVQREATALATHVRWSLPATAAVSALVVAELLLLPSLAPGGACLGTLAAQGLFELAGQPHSLAGLLEASQGLEWVQGFSLARKVGQLALLDMAVRWVTDGKPRQVFGMSLGGGMDRQRGWAVWACHALVGLAAINLMQQGLDAALLATTGAGVGGPAGAGPAAAAWLAGGDERTLPFRCRLWAETCLAAPLLEETVFRGFLITSFAKYMPAWGAVLGSSALFALCHMGSVPWTSLPALTGMGCVLGVAFLRTRNLLAPLAAHSASNTVALLAADAAASTVSPASLLA